MKQLLMVLMVLMPIWALAASGGHTYPNDSIVTDYDHKGSLQRGMRNFVNYCMGCHGASYMRYNRAAQDLGIPDDLMVENLIFRTNQYGEKEKVGSLMLTSMSPEYGGLAFGVAPPDLTLITRSKGADWLYNYMRAFYQDTSRPLGFNNSVFPGVGMPHVLWKLEGVKAPVYDDSHNVVDFDTVSDGLLDTVEYDDFVYDLVNFLDYVGEPYKRDRQRVGIYILIFLGIFGVLAYALKKEFWRAVK